MNVPWNQTKRAVVALVRRDGPISRIQLARKLRLTKAAMTQVVHDLLDEGVLTSGGQLSTVTRGRREELVKIGKGGAYAIGLSVAIDYNVELALVDVSNHMVAHKKLLNQHPTNYENPVQYANLIAREIERLKKKVPGEWIVGVAVAVTGELSPDRQLMSVSNDFPTTEEANEFLTELARLLPDPISINNAVNAAAVAELWLDKTLPAAPSLLYINDHLCMELILDGVTNSSLSPHPKWLGHFQVDPNGKRCFCGRHGCLCMTASLFSVVDQAAGFPAGERPPMSAAQSQKEIRATAKRYVQGDVEVRQLVKTAFEHLGQAINSLSNLFSLDLIVIGSWAGLTPNEEMKRLRAIITAGHYEAKDRPKPAPVVRWSSQGNHQDAFGAAMSMIDRALQPRIR